MLWRVENVDSIPHFYLQNHVDERFHLTFKSLSGHVRCLSLKSSIKSLGFDKSSNPFSLQLIGYLKSSIACLCKTLCDNFYHEQAMKGRMDVIGAEKGRASHPRTGPKTSQISFNQRLNIFQSIFDNIKHFLLSFAMFSFSSSPSHYKIHLWKWNRNRGTSPLVLGIAKILLTSLLVFEFIYKNPCDVCKC